MFWPLHPIPLKTCDNVTRPCDARSGATTLNRPGVVLGNVGLCAPADAAAIDATRIIDAAKAARWRRFDVNLMSILLIG
jgi:hypothetical protein